MKFKKIMLVSLMLMAILTIGAASANDDLTAANEEALQDTSSQEIELSDDGDIISSSQEEIIKETDNGTFTALQNKIDNLEEGSTLTLENAYAYDEGFNVSGLTLSKSLTIDGKGYTIDAKSQSGLFYITAGDVVLKNITFANGQYYFADGGSIYNNGTNFTIDSCTFKNCSASYGGAVYNEGDNFTLSSCNFTDCAADFGGAVYNFAGAGFAADSCTFNNCSASGKFDYDVYGGAIHNYDGADFTVAFCTFNNCSAGAGGAVYNSGVKCNVDSCTFNNCSASFYNGCGGAVYNGGAYCSLYSCTFNKCCASYEGGAIYNYYGAYFTADFCTFNKCSASYGGAVYNYAAGCTLMNSNFINNTAANRYFDWYSAYSITESNNTYIESDIEEATFAALQKKIDDAQENSTITLKNDYTYNTGFVTSGIKIYKTITIDGEGHAIDANSQSGIFFITASNVVLKNITFKNAYANYGGAVYNEGDNFTVDSCTFNNCSATYGGAIYNLGANCRATDSNFTDLDESEAAYQVTFINCIFESSPYPKTSTGLTASKVTATYAVSKKLTVTLKDANGNALADKKVTIKVGTISKTLNTDSNGQASVVVSSLVPKTYSAAVKFAGDDSYITSSKSVSVAVKKATPKITAKAKTFKKSVKTKKYTITLKNNLKKVMKKAKVYIKVNGKTYSAKTNNKGVATFKITKLTKKGTFKSVITYKGSSYYNKVTKKVNIKVK